MSYATYEQIGEGKVAYTVEIRSDLFMDIDVDGAVVGVERIGDQVRDRDLADVIRALVYVARTDEAA